MYRMPASNSAAAKYWPVSAHFGYRQIVMMCRIVLGRTVQMWNPLWGLAHVFINECRITNFTMYNDEENCGLVGRRIATRKMTQEIKLFSLW